MQTLSPDWRGPTRSGYARARTAQPDWNMNIGPWKLSGRVLLAPMAGITDLPFRQLCRQWGAALAVSEMLSADPTLRKTRKSQWRATLADDECPRVAQIAGADPVALAEAARYNVQRGAQVIDINMGCPAKKVCNRMAGSALLADEPLVRRILTAVVSAVEVPVTLKYRTGPSPERRNAVAIARMAEDAGVAALTLHGRTRVQAYQGQAEYRSVEAVCRAVDIPVVANGDIDSPDKARQVLDETGADAVMVGRAAQGRPWLFQAIHTYLETGTRVATPSLAVRKQTLLTHLREIHRFYGDWMGPRIARKHIKWYLQALQVDRCHVQPLMQPTAPEAQRVAVADCLSRLNEAPAAAPA
ncbi:tRNA-U20-dihydrouridine synthase [Alkalilimnicola ehrlichii MLHE-1]|uniref:tRNA-dihydrouridine synthase B n=2 Tax=Alkalilimnicola ehrlichii TaxID=351052 RepID=Q0A8T9_ALKEH|nr:tRNA-U20-dihydrouridine synthase [Alkalilimnicola ehrlichii MLHE-1]